MRKIFIVICGIFFTLLTVAQSGNQGSNYKITYLKTDRNSSDPGKFFLFSCPVFINDSASYTVEVVTNRDDHATGSGATFMYAGSDSGSIVYKNIRHHYLVFNTGNPLAKGIYTDTLNNMQWTIDTATRKIDSFTCTKATTRFRGTDYTAWFSPDIPMSNGPSKFGGLPGLIMELHDSDNFVNYRLQKIEPSSYVFPVFTNAYPDFAVYKAKARKNKRILEERIKASENDGNCIDCQSTVTVTVTNWENIYD